MLFKLIRYCFLILCLHLSAQTEDEQNIEAPLQQQNVDTDVKSKTKFGIKFSLGLHTFKGTEFSQTRPSFGFGVGFYQIIDLNKKKDLQLQWELNATYKGSKFGYTNDTSFSKISLLYAELPVFTSIKLFNTKKNNPFYLLVGAQFGVLLSANITKGYGQLATVAHGGLPFKKTDVSPLIGFRKNLGSGISLQSCIKYGLININTPRLTSGTPDSRYRDLVPAMTGKGTIHNLSFDISFLF